MQEQELYPHYLLSDDIKGMKIRYWCCLSVVRIPGMFLPAPYDTV